MNESKLRENYKNIQNNTFKEITKILKNNNYDVYNNLSDFIASIFNVDRSDMLSKSLDRDICRARWMLWSALYNFYEKTYEEIAKLASYEDNTTTGSGVLQGIKKLNEEMQNSINLKDKWFQVRQLITLGRSPHNYSNDLSKTMGYKPQRIKVCVPKDVEVDIVKE